MPTPLDRHLYFKCNLLVVICVCGSKIVEINLKVDVSCFVFMLLLDCLGDEDNERQFIKLIRDEKEVKLYVGVLER